MTKTNGGPREPVAAIAEYEAEQVKRANSTGRQPVAFVHGLWLLPSSRDRWARLFEETGYTALTPGWPNDPETVEDAKRHPEVFAGKTIGQIADTTTGSSVASPRSRRSSDTRSAACSRRSLPDGGWRAQPSRSTRHPSTVCCRSRSRR